MKTKTCFVIMPFSATASCSEYVWTTIYGGMIKPAVTGSRLGFTCERANPQTGNIIKGILNKLDVADIVIADLTDMNPNVFYELGVRHTLRKRTILITQNIQDIPSDLQSYWVVEYRRGKSGRRDFAKNIRRIIREMVRDPEKPDSPVADFLKETNRTLLSQEKSASAKKLTALCSELSYNIKMTDELNKKLAECVESRKTKKKNLVPVIRFDDSCIDLLLSTQYIALPDETLNKIRKMKVVISTSHRRLDAMSEERYYESALQGSVGLMPDIKSRLIQLLKEINKIRVDFLNDNYQEPELPTIMMADASHKEYLMST
jgi:hypothetical protein